MNKAYHLEVEAYSMRFGCLREKNACYANLFFSHEEAYQKGKEVMDRRGNGSVVSPDNEGYVNLVRVHKQHLLPYTGEVPENINVLRKIIKGETNISLKRLKEFYGENFIEDITPPCSIPHSHDDITDDSTDTAPFLTSLIATHQLALPNAPVYRLFEK